MTFLDLKKALNHIHPLSDNEWGLFESFIRKSKYCRGVSFQRIGEIPKYFAFIDKGLFKVTFNKDDGKEVIKLFSFTGQFLGAYADYICVRPSRVNIVAITDSEVTLIPFEAMEQLTSLSPVWEKYRRVIAENQFVIKEEREFQLLINDANQRYRQFMDDFESISKDIPDYMIAAYLNVTPSYLSTLKSRSLAGKSLTSDMTLRFST